MQQNKISPILYLPHGGGPLPLLGDSGHREMVTFLQNIRGKLGEPQAILIISAHWEASQPTIQSAEHPEMLYDYYGFPPETYKITYPASGHPLWPKRLGMSWTRLVSNPQWMENEGLTMVFLYR